MNSRRQFLRHLAITAPALLGSRTLAQETPPATPTPPTAPTAPVQLTEDDPVAMALGYKMDAGQVDATRYPQFKPGQQCDGCALYTGQPGATEGPCTVFQNKIVTAKGWCATYAPKPSATPATPPPAPAQ